VAAPEFVPVDPVGDDRVYRGPLRPTGTRVTSRPADLGAGQPRGTQLGNQGPDQGFALTIAEGFRDRLCLAPGEHAEDAIAGAVAVATKRSSLFGRAPVVHDVVIGLTVWGLLDEDADEALVAERRSRFADIAHHHHYRERRAVADAVGDEVLRQTPDEVSAAYRADWRALLAF
jgi:hypothetical protein